MVSFQSTYKSTFRIEVPVWPDVQHTKKAMSSPDYPGRTLTDSAVERNTQMAMPVPATNEEKLETPKATDPECDEEEVEDDTYVPPEGEGCFRQSLLLRANYLLCTEHWK